MISILVASILLISVIVKWKSYSFLGKDFFKFGLKRSFSGLHDKILKLILVYTGTTTILEMYYGHYSIISDKIIEFSVFFLALIIINTCYSFWLYDIDELVGKYIVATLNNSTSKDNLRKMLSSDINKIEINDFTIKKLRKIYENNSVDECNIFIELLVNNLVKKIRNEEFNKEHIDIIDSIKNGKIDKNTKMTCFNLIESNII